MKVQVPFQQLLTVVKTLTPAQKARLRKELDESTVKQQDDTFIDFLLNGPVYADEDIAIIEENRKSISEWRTEN